MIQENNLDDACMNITLVNMVPPDNTDFTIDVRVRVRSPVAQAKPTVPYRPGKDIQVVSKIHTVRTNVHNSAAPGHFQRKGPRC